MRVRAVGADDLEPDVGAAPDELREAVDKGGQMTPVEDRPNKEHQRLARRLRHGRARQAHAQGNYVDPIRGDAQMLHDLAAGEGRDGDDGTGRARRQPGQPSTPQALAPAVPLGVRGKRHVVHRDHHGHAGRQRRRVAGRKEDVWPVTAHGAGERALFPARVPQTGDQDDFSLKARWNAQAAHRASKASSGEVRPTAPTPATGIADTGPRRSHDRSVPGHRPRYASGVCQHGGQAVESVAQSTRGRIPGEGGRLAEPAGAHRRGPDGVA